MCKHLGIVCGGDKPLCPGAGGEFGFSEGLEAAWIPLDPRRDAGGSGGSAGRAAGASSLPPAANLQLGEGERERGRGMEKKREREALRVLSDEVIPKKDKGSGACINLSGDVSRGKKQIKGSERGIAAILASADPCCSFRCVVVPNGGA